MINSLNMSAFAVTSVQTNLVKKYLEELRKSLSNLNIHVLIKIFLQIINIVQIVIMIPMVFIQLLKK